MKKKKNNKNANKMGDPQVNGTSILYGATIITAFSFLLNFSEIIKKPTFQLI